MTKDSILRAIIYIPTILLILWLASGILNPKEKVGSWIWLVAIAAGLLLSYVVTKIPTPTKNNSFSVVSGIILATILWFIALLLSFGGGPN